MEKLVFCPVCNSTEFSSAMECKDFTYSQSYFNLVDCKKCGFRFTNPRPDVSEIGKYYQAPEYISHSDSQKGLVNKLYHLVRNYTLMQKLKLIFNLRGGIKKGISNTLLDIGCGTGAFLNVCKNAGFECEGIEPDENARALAIAQYGLKVSGESALEGLPEKHYDVITLWHVLEHVPLLNERIVKIKSLLKENGHLIIAVPNCASYDAQHYGNLWAAYDVPRHLYHFTPATMGQLIEKHELKIARILPMVFDSFYVSLLSEKYKTGKTNFISGMWTGLLSNIKAIKTGKEFSSQIYVVRN